MGTKNTLTLNKCAYIFHWSNSNFSFDKTQYKTKINIQKRLKTFYNDFNERNEIPYYLKNGNCFINLDGLEICVNDKMIYRINGEHPRKNIINNIHFADIKTFAENRTDCYTRCGDTIYHNSLKTLYIESFGKTDDLRFFRMYFKNNKYILVVSNKTLYSHSDIYTEIKIKDILNALDAKGNAKARKFITDFCEFITNK
jgi:hypothetical protein